MGAARPNALMSFSTTSYLQYTKYRVSILFPQPDNPPLSDLRLNVRPNAALWANGLIGLPLRILVSVLIRILITVPLSEHPGPLLEPQILISI